MSMTTTQTKTQVQSLSRRYELAWNKMFASLPAWKRDIIIEEPHGRHSTDLSGAAAALAEKDNEPILLTVD